MNSLFRTGALLAAGIVVTLPSLASEDIFSDIIVVTARREIPQTEIIYADEAVPVSADGASLISRLPGAALIRNGSLSGQVQFRGAYGFRVGTRVNGQSFHPGGPNLMDPPMHYAPPTLVEAIEVNRGAAPVAFGPSLVGGVNTELKQVSFSETGIRESHYDVTLIGRSADRSHGLGLVAGVATDAYRAFGFYSNERGHDLDWSDGEIDNTFHDREVIGAGFGFKTSESEWELELRRHETGPTGNSPFAMDIDWVEMNFARLGYRTTLGQTRLDVAIGFSDVDHGMSNSLHRPPPASMMRYRANRALAETLTLAVDLSSELDRGDLSYGLDLDLAQMSSTIDNPQNSAFFVEPLPDIDQDRAGAYISWRQGLGAGEVEIGARIDRHDSKAGLTETGAAVPMMPSMLAIQFNQGRRDWQDTTYDLLARYWMDTDLDTWRFSLARKNRVPTHLERFGWLPIAASAGLADGNNYVGDRQLDPEVAWVLEAGIGLARGAWWLRPTIFYHRVSDYIQGIPFDATVGVADSMVEMVSMMNGDGTPLRFGNVDARMVGFDADFGWQLSQFWRVEGVASIVRGERRDLGDDLYRISPDRFRLGLTYARSAWSVTLEGMAVAAQEHVSDTNSEVETAGYGLFNLHGDWQMSESLHISGGIENLFDREYRDHLSGYNRVRNSDVAVGERLPGVGRNAFVRISWRR